MLEIVCPGITSNFLVQDFNAPGQLSYTNEPGAPVNPTEDMQ